jgi:hypothetical protein
LYALLALIFTLEFAGATSPHAIVGLLEQVVKVVDVVDVEIVDTVEIFRPLGSVPLHAAKSTHTAANQRAPRLRAIGSTYPAGALTNEQLLGFVAGGNG